MTKAQLKRLKEFKHVLKQMINLAKTNTPELPISHNDGSYAPLSCEQGYTSIAEKNTQCVSPTCFILLTKQKNIIFLSSCGRFHFPFDERNCQKKHGALYMTVSHTVIPCW